MTRLWLIRHGPTHAKGMVGWTDLPADLSDAAQIARLRAALPDAPVVSSDLLRAVQTGDVLTPVSRLPHDPQLREINFGDWENLTFAHVELGAPEGLGLGIGERVRASGSDSGLELGLGVGVRVRGRGSG